MQFAFPIKQLRIQRSQSQLKVWDILRRKWFILTNEEFVRQQLLHYLIDHKKISPALISVERGISYNKRQKRFDLVVFDSEGMPSILCECKAPEVPLKQETIYQIIRYNAVLAAPHLLLTNGHELWFFSRNEQEEYIPADF